MKVAALTSGGVDSSVALIELKRQGYDVTAFYLKIWLDKELSFLGQCPWKDDLKIVQDICKQNDIPFEAIDLQREYYKNVVLYTLSELKSGRTPNSDVMCNRHVKFGEFFDEIEGFDTIATGHYAKRADDGKHTFMLTNPDPVKDQTYFLCQLTTEQLKRAWFPLGNWTKDQVRERAREFGLLNAERKDSQGVCFLGKISYTEFIRHHLGERPGKIIDENGHCVGTHAGYWFFTEGQRKGLNLPGGPWYVCGKDVERNIVYISREAKTRNHFIVDQLNWFNGEPSDLICSDLRVKLRHGTKFISAKMNKEDWSVELSEPDAIAPGQFAAFYWRNFVLGGGVIQ